MLLHDLTWMEVRDMLPQEPVIIQPLGATEQHGPHLPLQVDIASAYAVATAAGERTGCIVAPPLPFGASGPWENFPGTISFSSETFMACIRDIAESLVRTGFKKIFFLNGHYVNHALLQTSIVDCMGRYGREGEVIFASATYFLLNRERCDEIGDNFREGPHANEFETAFMMHLQPDKVHLDRLGDWEYKPEWVTSYELDVTAVSRKPDSRTHNGVYGDPRRATPERGAQYFEACVEKVAEVVENFNRAFFKI